MSNAIHHAAYPETIHVKQHHLRTLILQRLREKYKISFLLSFYSAIFPPSCIKCFCVASRLLLHALLHLQFTHKLLEFTCDLPQLRAGSHTAMSNLQARRRVNYLWWRRIFIALTVCLCLVSKLRISCPQAESMILIG